MTKFKNLIVNEAKAEWRIRARYGIVKLRIFSLLILDKPLLCKSKQWSFDGNNLHYQFVIFINPFPSSLCTLLSAVSMYVATLAIHTPIDVNDPDPTISERIWSFEQTNKQNIVRAMRSLYYSLYKEDTLPKFEVYWNM